MIIHQQADGWQDPEDLAHLQNRTYLESDFSAQARAFEQSKAFRQDIVPERNSVFEQDSLYLGGQSRPIPHSSSDWYAHTLATEDSRPAIPTTAQARTGRVPWIESVSDNLHDVRPATRSPDFNTDILTKGNPNQESAGLDETSPIFAAGLAKSLPITLPIQLPASDPSLAREQTELNPFDGMAALLHDARNMVTAIDLYCDLLDVPGVLSVPFRHYAGDLRLVAGGSRRLLEKMAQLEWTARNSPTAWSRSLSGDLPASPNNGVRDPYQLDHLSFSSEDLWDPLPADVVSTPNSTGISIVGRNPAFVPGLESDVVGSNRETSVRAFPRTDKSRAGSRLSNSRRRFLNETEHPVGNLADAILANHRLLSTLVGPGITIGISIEGGNQPVNITADDFTRILVNLARNAATAMPTGGHIQIGLVESESTLHLSFADTGVGIPETALEAIFATGYTTKICLEPDAYVCAGTDAQADLTQADLTQASFILDPQLDSYGPSASSGSSYEPVFRRAKPSEGRGLGLAIVRSIVSSAAGVISASNLRSVANSHVSPATSESLAALSEPGLSLPFEPASSNSSDPSGAVFLINFPIAKDASTLPHRSPQNSSQTPRKTFSNSQSNLNTDA